MTEHDYPQFLLLLKQLANCYLAHTDLQQVSPLYFEDLQPFGLDVVAQAMRRARKKCHFFPTIAEVIEQAESIQREAAEVQREAAKAEQQEENQRKRLTEEQAVRDNRLSPAQRLIAFAEIYANLHHSMNMHGARPPEPRLRPPERDEEFLTTVDNAARKEELRDQLAQIQREEPVTHG